MKKNFSLVFEYHDDYYDISETEFDDYESQIDIKSLFQNR